MRRYNETEEQLIGRLIDEAIGDFATDALHDTINGIKNGRDAIPDAAKDEWNYGLSQVPYGRPGFQNQINSTNPFRGLGRYFLDKVSGGVYSKIKDRREQQSAANAMQKDRFAKGSEGKKFEYWESRLFNYWAYNVKGPFNLGKSFRNGRWEGNRKNTYTFDPNADTFTKNSREAYNPGDNAVNMWNQYVKTHANNPNYRNYSLDKYIYQKVNGLAQSGALDGENNIYPLRGHLSYQEYKDSTIPQYNAVDDDRSFPNNHIEDADYEIIN